MYRSHFLDPLGSQLPALERNILKLRALHMVLVLFYAEELKRKIVGLIQDTESLMALLKPGSIQERVPKGCKNPVGKALTALVNDKALTSEDKVEIESLLKYRNTVGHRMHELVADLSDDKFMRRMRNFDQDYVKEFDYEAIGRFQYFRKKLGRLHISHHYILELSSDRRMFQAAEKVYLAEEGILRRKIERLIDLRKQSIARINAEISFIDAGFFEEGFYPTHPLHKYDNGRLTRRGVEVCCRFYDSGRSPIAVAHLMKISLRSARHWHKFWSERGGANRPTVELDMLPRRGFYRRDDD